MAEEQRRKDLLARAKTRDIYFVIPFDSQEAPVDPKELERNLRHAKSRFASLSDHGEN